MSAEIAKAIDQFEQMIREDSASAKKMFLEKLEKLDIVESDLIKTEVKKLEKLLEKKRQVELAEENVENAKREFAIEVASLMGALNKICNRHCGFFKFFLSSIYR